MRAVLNEGYYKNYLIKLIFHLPAGEEEKDGECEEKIDDPMSNLNAPKTSMKFSF